jgi:glycosyltransferase involved in cell wall biosynthesis
MDCRKVSIIIPAYNEEELIYKTISETLSTMDELGVGFEIIVVNDGSQDGTFEEASRASTESSKVNVKVVTYSKNMGKGHAVRYGFNYATGDLIAFLDADLDLHPRQIGVFMEYMDRYGSDLVIGSKRHPLSQISYPSSRRMLSSAYSIVIKSMFGISLTDTQAGLKLFKRDVLESIFPMMVVEKYAYDLEMLVIAHELGYRIVEAPIKLDFQRRVGRIRIKDVFFIAKDTLSIWQRSISKSRQRQV